jgi:porin
MGLGIAFFILVLAGPSMGGELAPGWRERDHLTGDWNGARTRLLDLGLEPYAVYTAGFWSNIRGGLDTGTRYEGFADWGLDARLEALLGWRGGRFHIGWHGYHGGQPSEDLVGPFPANAVSGNEAEQSFRFFEIFLEQRFFENRLVAKVGQLALDQDFMVAEHAQIFRNAVFGEFISSAISTPIAVYPLAAPGLYLEVEPLPNLELRIGVYTGDPGEDETDNIGFDWSISSDAGATIMGEIAIRQRFFDLSGTYSFGVLGHTGDAVNYERGGESDGMHFLYAMVEQTLFEIPGADDNPGAELAAFFRYAVPTRSDRVAIDWEVNGGLALSGAIPGRFEDSIGLGFAYLDFADDYLRQIRASGERVTGSELTLELTYRARLANWLVLQPDLQYFVDPHFGRSDALAVGLSVEIDL